MPLAHPLPKVRPRAALGHLRRRRVVGASLAAIASRRALAQSNWPRQPVRIIVGLPAGGQGDLIARGLAPHFSAAFGQPFVVENRPGAGGVIGAGAVAAATDGHTIGIVLGGPTTTARALNPAVPYDPATAFTAVSQLTRVPFALTLHPGLPVRDWAGFLAHVRANPGRLSYASVGPGTVTHLAMEELKDRFGLDIAHVPYRGFPAATLDLIAGRVAMMWNVPSSALEHLRSGALVAIAQSGEARLRTLPDIPTLEELGLSGTSFFGWNGIVAPAGFPQEAAERIAAVAREALARDPASRGGLDLAGSEILGTSPAVLARLQASEAARWNAVIARLGLRATD
jgi:tripartite-type tricarboxylate transporter receptor subunit TctC